MSPTARATPPKSLEVATRAETPTFPDRVHPVRVVTRPQPSHRSERPLHDWDAMTGTSPVLSLKRKPTLGCQAPLPKLLFLLPTHGRRPRRPYGRGRHQAERGRRCHQVPWRSLGDREPTAPATAGFAHGPAVPRTRSGYARPVVHIAGRRWQEGREPCPGRDAEQHERPPSPNCFPEPPSRSPASALPPPSALSGPERLPSTFRCRSLGNHLPQRYFRVVPEM